MTAHGGCWRVTAGVSEAMVQRAVSNSSGGDECNPFARYVIE
jgi:hypothetical protein